MKRIIHACKECFKPIVCLSATRRPTEGGCDQTPPYLCSECGGKSK